MPQKPTQQPTCSVWIQRKLVSRNDRAKEFKSANNFSGIIMPKDTQVTPWSLTYQLHAVLVTWHGLFLTTNLITQTQSERFFVPLLLLIRFSSKQHKQTNKYWPEDTTERVNTLDSIIQFVLVFYTCIQVVKVEIKFTIEQAMKTQRERIGIALVSL
jgi:hypothetical protein